MIGLTEMQRHKTAQVSVGGVLIGGSAPVVVQSMTDTDTSDIEKSANQVEALANAGSEIVRLTVANEENAKAIPKIRDLLDKKDVNVALVGCFHYNGHTLLEKYPDMAGCLDKYRINPGNVGFGHKRDLQFSRIIETAIKHGKPVRIGVNWGSLDQDLATKLMDENAKSKNPVSSGDVMRETLVRSALDSAKLAMEIGLAKDKIVLSAKTSRVPDLIAVYRTLAARSDYALHVGLTEAGMGEKGVVSAAVASGILLHEGIGDTLRVSLTPRPNQSRTTEVRVCQDILQSLGIREFMPQVSSCPGCGRTTSVFFRELAQQIEGHLECKMKQWKNVYSGVETMNVAVMGCIVNGPGESKHANIGISLPGNGEDPSAPVFIDGRRTHILKGDDIAEQFINLIDDYVSTKYSKKQKSHE